MLPEYLNIKHVDKRLREPIVRLNKLPYVVTISSCEGHVSNDVDGWYLSEGLITLQTDGSNKAKDFLKRLEYFCSKYDFVSLMDGEPKTEEQINDAMNDRRYREKYRVYGFKFPLGRDESYIVADRLEDDKEIVIDAKRKVNRFWKELTYELSALEVLN